MSQNNAQLRAEVKALRDKIRTAKQEQVAAAAAESDVIRTARLTAERDALKAQLAAITGTPAAAPASAPASATVPATAPAKN